MTKFLKKFQSHLNIILLVIALSILILAYFFRIYSSGKNSSYSNVPLEVGKTENTSHEFTFIADKNDTNAFMATSKRTSIVTKNYDFGVMVEAINGTTADQKHFWALYVNNAFSPTGAEQTVLKEGDAVTWKYQEIESGL